MIRLAGTFFLTMILLAGCTAHPRVKLTEVAAGTVEIYLDRQSSFDVSRLSLRVETGAGHSNSFNLLGTMSGRSYLVVFEENGYAGQPVPATYVDPSRTFSVQALR
jgi:hypothetical protein